MTNKLTSLLGSTLIDSTGNKHDTSTIAKSGKEGILIYFSAHWCGPCRQFTPKLKELYENSLNTKCEVIFCSHDKSQQEFDQYFEEMPWKAIPFEEEEVRAALKDTFNVTGIPTLISLDLEGNVLSKDAKAFVFSDPEGKAYPWKDKTVYELVGDVISNDGSVTTSSDLKKKAVLALYFSAHWCPPCRQATPILAKLYNKLQSEGKDMEIVFCSSDRDESAFQEYFEQMPWKAIPFERRADKDALSRRFSVSGIPTLVLLEGGSLKMITDNGIQHMYEDSEGKEFPWRPAPLMPLSNQSMSMMNGGRLLVMLTDGVKDADKASGFETSLRNLAERKVKQWEDLEKRPLYFTFGGKSSSLAPQVRQFLVMGEPTEKAGVVIVDGKTGVAYTMTDDVSEASLETFVDDVLEGRASGKVIG